MAYNQPPGNTGIGKIGSNDYVSEPKGFLDKLCFVEKGHSFATQILAETESGWIDLIKQTTGRGFPSPRIVEMIDNTADPVQVTHPNGQTRLINLAKYDYAGYWDVSDSVMVRLYSLNDKDLDVYFFWKSKSIEGANDSDGVLFYPKSMSEFVVAKRTMPLSDNVQRVYFFMKFDNNADFNELTASVHPSWNPNLLDALRGVNITASNPGAGSLDVTVIDEHGKGLEGLIAADFVSSVSGPSGAVDNGGGSYSLSGLGAGETTITLVAAASISLMRAFVESNGVSNEETVTA